MMDISGININKADFHSHTFFSDGHASPEDMILSAIEKGLSTYGISDHSYTAFDTSWCMQKENILPYKKKMKEMKSLFSGRINFLCGIEEDYYSDEPTEDYDYVIGSVHYIKIGDEYLPIDNKPEYYIDGANKYFNSDIYSLVEAYYDVIGDIVNKTNADIIGHFDIITKFNEKAPMIDTKNPRYIKAWQRAADEILKKKDVLFEINTGAISRGWRRTPYPADDIVAYIKGKGGRFVFGSDSHSPENVAFMMDEARKLM